MKRLVVIFILTALLALSVSAHIPAQESTWRTQRTAPVDDARFQCDLGVKYPSMSWTAADWIRLRTPLRYPQKVYVPGMGVRWIICQNNPVMYTDPTGKVNARYDQIGGGDSPGLNVERIEPLDPNTSRILTPTEQLLALAFYCPALLALAPELAVAGVGGAAIELSVPASVTIYGPTAAKVTQELLYDECTGTIGLSTGCSQVAPVVDDVYKGIKEASEYLIEIGVDRKYRKTILESFEKTTVTLRKAGADEYGIRYYDDINAWAEGRYLFETFPATRQSIALPPNWNQMTKIQQWKIIENTIIIEGRAAPQGIYYSGGQIQKYICDPSMGYMRP